MVQRDYILRMIEQAGTVLKRLLGLVRSHDVTREDMNQELQRAAQLGGLDLELLRISDIESLWHMVALTGEPDPSRTWLAAETLYLDGLAAEMEGDAATAAHSYAKAASLYGILEPSWVLPTGFPEAKKRLEDISERITTLER